MSIAKKLGTKPKRSKAAPKRVLAAEQVACCLQAEGRGDQVKGNLKQAGSKIKDAFKH